MQNARQDTLREGYWVFPRVWTVQADRNGAAAVEILRELLRDSQTELTESRDAVLRLETDETLAGEEARFAVTADGVRITYGVAAGARNAVLTLYNSLEKMDGSYTLPCSEAVDYPDSRFRGMLMDMARRYIEPEEVRANLRQMALAKMNRVIFHLMDSHHYALHSEAFPALNHGKFPQYSMRQMRELVEYAAFWGIEVIPSLDLPAHAAHLLRSLPELACQVEDAAFQESHWAVCIGSERTYEVAETLYREVFTVFDSSLLMLCGDELEFTDLGLWPNWEHCTRCRALAQREGLTLRRELFTYFVRRIHAIASRMGKRLIVSNDNLDIEHLQPGEVPQDLLIFWWAVPRRYPETYTLEKFLQQGFEVINCSYEDCYIDLYMTQERLADWSPLTRPACPPEYAAQVAGGCLCAWEGQEHFLWTVPSGILMMGDKLWNGAPAVYDRNYAVRLTRRLLGADTPAGLDVFTPLGGCLLPLDGDRMADAARKGFPERVPVSVLPELERTLEALHRLAEASPVQAPLCEVYALCLRWMRAQLMQRQTLPGEDGQ